MRIRHYLLAFLSLAVCTFAGEARPYVLGGTEIRDLPVSKNGRQYQLIVGLPFSYQKGSERRYPVVYLCDGYWDFVSVRGATGNLVYDKTAPEFLLVGLSYVGENVDYNQMRVGDLAPPRGQPADVRASASATFLSVIRDEIIPFIEKEYPADPAYRVLAGSSYGGLFVIDSLLEEPDLFQAYLSVAPYVTWNDNWIFSREAEFFAQGGKINARVLITAGDGEAEPDVRFAKLFAEQLRSRNHPGLVLKWRLIDDGEGHAGQKPEAYNRGLRFALAPLLESK
ncbi:alpha/beta hydrolase [Nibricoccus sp. IMCC34717]|uniref:alpha/beta hydrolase n=1 Tax=Nibricoccus sp. IMCC34717 TaxID=3034021 RepID=UPI00384DE99F